MLLENPLWDLKESAAISVERISDVIFSAEEKEFLSLATRIFLLEVSLKFSERSRRKSHPYLKSLISHKENGSHTRTRIRLSISE